ncbi:hypothetical protein ACI65C_007141 [Semiaphis heraclei]
MNSTNNTTMATTLISVDQAILVRMQNENETLHKLVMELQASNAQLQSQLLDIQVSNTITNNTNTTTAISKNVHNEVGHSSVISSNAQTKHTQLTANDVIQSVPKIYKPPPITACGVNDIQNLVTILTREEVAGHEQQLKTFANERVHPKKITAVQRILQKPTKTVTAAISYALMTSSPNINTTPQTPNQQQQSNVNDPSLLDILSALTNITKSLEKVTSRLDRLESNQSKSNNKSQKKKTTLEETTTLSVKLKTPSDIEMVVQKLTKDITEAIKVATPIIPGGNNREITYPLEIRELVQQKRKARRTWHRTRHPEDKTNWNRISKILRDKINEMKNETFKSYLSGLSATDDTDYSLWKATRRIIRPHTHVPPIRKINGTWARSEQDKAEVYAQYLENVFQPNDIASELD